MNESATHQNVVVTDVHMPFWSMVVFMVKWSIAAIPAVIILVTITFLSATAVSALLSSSRLTSHEVSYPVADQQSVPTYSTNAVTPVANQTNRPQVGDRCKGSTEPEKCMELERRLQTETPEQRAARQKALEAERQENMRKVQ